MAHPGTLLKSHGLRASKKRGQNFLVHPATAQAIAASAGIGPGEVVVEIGAGLGALTLACARLAARVVALEVDRGLFRALEQVLAGAGADNVELRLQDALDVDWEELAATAGGPVTVVGNLPYAISSPLLLKLVSARECWQRATLMLQRELAQRLSSPPGNKDYGRLSVLVQTWCEIEPGFSVGPDQFFPRPAVESRIVHLKSRRDPLVPLADGEQAAWFQTVVKAAFSQRRKTLANSLAGGLGRDRPGVAQALTRAGIDPRRRAETLSPQEFFRAAQELAD
jgi:16S rRNA (adenine1518-N6/adenine1519-N6)-dimethyltransferase